MRDRLIEILLDGVTFTDEYKFPARKQAEYVADRLLANGVIVPPCKVGDTVYMPWQWGGTDGIAILTIERISITEARPTVRTDFYSDDYAYFDKYNCGVFSFDDFGKTVFLTREEAEKALARMKGEGE